VCQAFIFCCYPLERRVAGIYFDLPPQRDHLDLLVFFGIVGGRGEGFEALLGVAVFPFFPDRGNDLRDLFIGRAAS